MNTDFQIQALDHHHFLPYMQKTDFQLQAQGAKWLEVTAHPGFPCRVTLQDAKVGERVLAISFQHLPESSPYQSSGPVFVREGALTTQLAVNEIPEVLPKRLLSLRGYDQQHLMIEADVVEGRDIEAAIRKVFSNPLVNYLHIHNARPGCFACAVKRAS